MKPTLGQLKSAVYDRLALIEKCQTEIKQLNQEIANFKVEEPKTDEPATN